jgi:hypothetical protein
MSTGDAKEMRFMRYPRLARRSRHVTLTARAGAAASALGLLLTLLITPARAQSTPGLPSLPGRWPTTLELGVFDGPGGAASLAGVAPFRFRYQYLAGGANTGGGWATWNPNGAFATYYIQDSLQHGLIPVFTYYMIFQSSPGGGSESNAVLSNLQNRSTMTAYLGDLRLFFQRAGAFPNDLVVLHVEPDMWGYAQQRASGDDASTVPAQVAATGLPELAGLPNTVAGVAQAVVRLRDTYAPNVVLGYHMSTWGTGNEIQYSDPPDATVDALATRAANFYTSLGAPFDITFAEFSDRDAAFKQYVYGDGGASWWNAGDFSRHVRFLTRFVELTRKRVVLWQIPLGNTKMRAVNNTFNHCQDNRVEWLLDDPSRGHLNDYVRAGVTGFLFGRGADGATCACDANGDGVTNPAPINGNTRVSLDADDDGGYFKERAREYYDLGAITLPNGGSGPTATPAAPTATPAGPTATPAAPTATPAGPTATAQMGYTTSARVSPATVAPGGTADVIANVTSAAASTVLIDLEVHGPGGALVAQKYSDNQTFAAGETKSFELNWGTPAGSAPGSYTIAIGVFSPGWGTLRAWNNQAAVFAVGNAQPTATASATPTVTRTPTAVASPTRTPAAVASPTRTPAAVASPTRTPASVSPGFTVTGSVAPGTVNRGGTVNATIDVSSRTAGRFVVDVELYGPTGQKVYQRWFGDQDFAAGQRRQYQVAWGVPANSPVGQYTWKVGAFSADWATLYTWNNQTAQFTVGS